MRSKIIWWALAFSIAANLLIFVEWKKGTPEPSSEGKAFAAPAPSLDNFVGKVEIHFSGTPGQTDMFQIIDRDHSVVCYGRATLGGASTISCQGFK